MKDRNLLTWALLAVLALGCDASADQQAQMAALESLPLAEQMARWEDPARLKWQKPEVLAAVLAGPEGQTIVEIGAGTGFVSRVLVGLRPQDTVLALEPQPELLAELKRRAASLPTEAMTRLRYASLPLDHAALPVQSANRILLVNTYGHLTDRVAYFRALHMALRSDGFLCIVDFRRGDFALEVATDTLARTPETVIAELRQAGYHSFDLDTLQLPYQYILTAR